MRWSWPSRRRSPRRERPPWSTDARLEQTLDGAARGGTSRLLLGEAGIGKTALLDVAAVIAPSGGQRFPSAVVSDAVLGWLSAGTQASPARVGAALLQLAAVLAESGLLLVTVDDVRWADPTSRQTLALAAGRLHAEPVAVLLAARTAA